MQSHTNSIPRLPDFLGHRLHSHFVKVSQFNHSLGGTVEGFDALAERMFSAFQFWLDSRYLIRYLHNQLIIQDDWLPPPNAKVFGDTDASNSQYPWCEWSRSVIRSEPLDDNSGHLLLDIIHGVEVADGRRQEQGQRWLRLHPEGGDLAKRRLRLLVKFSSATLVRVEHAGLDPCVITSWCWYVQSARADRPQAVRYKTLVSNLTENYVNLRILWHWRGRRRFGCDRISRLPRESCGCSDRAIYRFILENMGDFEIIL